MPLVIQYLLKLSISVAFAYLFYQLLLRRLTFYNWSRLYLLGYSLLSFFIPFINISSFTQQNNFDNAKVIRYIPVIENYTSAPTVNIHQSALPVHNTNGWQIFYLILIIGALIMLLRLFVQFISLQKIKRNASIINDAETIIYHVEENITPFSFGNAIYLNKNLHSESELREIILHEYVHVKEKHTADIFFSELLCIVNWYNPFAWLIRHAIRQNLEFIADNKVLQNGIEKKSYQYHLLKVVGTPQYRIANSFNFSSLKKRIAMMNKIKSAKLHLLRFLFMLPLVAVLLLAFRNKYQEIFKNKTVINDVGIIIDINSKQPIPGVSVTDTVSGLKTISDERGFYSLKIPVTTDTCKIHLRFNKMNYENFFTENTIPDAKLKTHGVIQIPALRPESMSKTLSSVYFWGFSFGKARDNPNYSDALKELEKVKHSDEDWHLYFKMQADHPEVTMFYTSEYKKLNIVIYKNGTVEKYGYHSNLTLDDMQKKFGKLPDVMDKNELPVADAYLAKWESVAAVAEKKFHTDNPNVYEIIFPGDSRAIAVPKNGKPRIYDLDNNVPEERPAFERLYGSLDGIVPPPTNNVNGFYYDDKYKSRRIEGFQFLGFASYDVDSKTSVTHFKGTGVLKINDPASAKGLILFNGKEYNANEFCKEYGNGIKKFADVFVYENKTAFDKFGEKGNHGVIVINDVQSLSFSKSNVPDNSIDKKDTVPSSVLETPACITLFWDDGMDDEHKNFFGRNGDVQLLNWLTEKDKLEIYHRDGSVETINLNDNNSVEKATAKYGKLPKPSGLVSPQKQNNISQPISNIDLTNTIVNGKMLTNPLIIIDGIESDTSGLRKLDPNKKYFMFILQDSALLKPYGEKGKNGVVMLSQRNMMLHQLR